MSRLERWSRLKRGDVPAQAPAPLERPLTSRESEDRDEEGPGVDQWGSTVSSDAVSPGSLDHTLPDPDTLPAGSDIKAYLASGVSSGLRKRALRRLFAANHYGIRDGLDDYDDDYRQTLQPLASEVADRLRHWTRHAEDTDDEASEAHAADTGDVSRPDAPLADDDETLADKDSAGSSHEAPQRSEDDIERPNGTS